MDCFQQELSIETRPRSFANITAELRRIVGDSGIGTGMCTVFVRHTSASLVIQENADPDVQRDLEAFLSRLVPDGDPLYIHVAEGDDDMPAHVKTALTRTSEQIPIRGARLVLGTWQGIYVWEHRVGRQRRDVVVHVLGE